MNFTLPKELENIEIEVIFRLRKGKDIATVIEVSKPGEKQITFDSPWAGVSLKATKIIMAWGRRKTEEGEDWFSIHPIFNPLGIGKKTVLPPAELIDLG